MDPTTSLRYAFGAALGIVALALFLVGIRKRKQFWVNYPASNSILMTHAGICFRWGIALLIIGFIIML